MKYTLAKLSAVALLLVGTAALAADESAPSTSLPSESSKSPGIQMQDESAPGASDYTPGRKTENVPSEPSPAPSQKLPDESGAGASERAPSPESAPPEGGSKY